MTDETLETMTLPTPAPVTPLPSTESETVPETAAGPEGVESTEGAEGESTEGAEEVFEAEITLPARGDERGERVKVPVPNQQVADAIRHQQKLAARVPKLEQEVESYRQDRMAVETLERDPLAGMLVLGQDPQVGQQFVTEWTRAYPDLAIKALTDLGLTVSTGSMDPRLLQAEAKLAQLEQQERLRRVQQDNAQRGTVQAFASQAGQVVKGFLDTLPFRDADEREEFTELAHSKMKKLYQTNARATSAEMTEALKGLVTRFAGTTPTSTPTRDDAGRFAATKERADKLRKVQGGRTGLTALTGAVDPNVTLETMFG